MLVRRHPYFGSSLPAPHGVAAGLDGRQAMQMTLEDSLRPLPVRRAWQMAGLD